MASVAFHHVVSFGQGLSTANSTVLENQIQLEILDGANVVKVARNAPGFVEQYDGNGISAGNKTTGTYEYTGTVDDTWALPLKMRYTIANSVDGVGICLTEIVGQLANVAAYTTGNAPDNAGIAAAASSAASAATSASTASTQATTAATQATTAATQASTAATASAAVKLQTDKIGFTGSGPYQVNSNAIVSGYASGQDPATIILGASVGHNAPVGTVEHALQSARAGAIGGLAIVGNQLVMYDTDRTTVLQTWNLSPATGPFSSRVAVAAQ